MIPAPGGLVRLQPRHDSEFVSMGRSVLATNRDGQITGAGAEGLFVHETRLLSRLQYLINGRAPRVVACSNVAQHSWLGYYAVAPHERSRSDGQDSRRSPVVSEHTIELRISRSVGGGMHEDLDLINYTHDSASIELTIAIDADFADIDEARGTRQQHGSIARAWRSMPDGGELTMRYAAQHHYEYQGDRGTAHIKRGLVLRVASAGSPPRRRRHGIQFTVTLGPRESWHACLYFSALIENQRMDPTNTCYAFGVDAGTHGETRAGFLHTSAAVTSVAARPLASTFMRVVERAKFDLLALRLYDCDHGEHAWTLAAGVPMYIALFGRDTLITAWQAALVSPDLMAGALSELAQWQGTRLDDWRDEQPNRMLHEAHTGPLAMLEFDPRRRYYGEITAPAQYPVVLAELWHWTGREDLVRPFIDPALRGLKWLDEWSDRNGDGFYDYQTHSTQGVKNQGWKDSGDAIVDSSGHEVEPPIAMATTQGYVYGAKALMAELLWWLGDTDRAEALYHEAQRLKKRFNEVFWMEPEQFVAMGLGPNGQPIRSISSGAGHALAAGIVADDHVRTVADRLLAPDMFSGWGVRTLSSDHPRFDPYSYHRGSVWPVEQGAFALGFFRYGLYDHVERLARGMIESAGLFERHRLPEVFSGHARDACHPFPAFYPKTNVLQAWSASSVMCLVQALLGLYPYAPLKLLVVDPHLPEWLPQITVERLRVGSAVVTIAFERAADGTTGYRILERSGTLHVVHQPSPWSLTAGFGQRIKDALSSLLPHTA